MEELPLPIWADLASGDMVSLRPLVGQALTGTVETRTDDGSIIWIRDQLNERKLFHFSDCQSVHLVGYRPGEPQTPDGGT